MRRIIIILSILLSLMSHHVHSQPSQEKHYQHLDSLITNGFIQDARKYMADNQAFFNDKKDDARVILNDLFLKYLEGYTSEDALEKIQEMLPAADESRTDLERAVRYYISAKMLTAYYQNNSYTINSRTASVTTDDMRFWGAGNYADTIISLYAQALSYHQVLLHTPIDKISILLSGHKNYKDIYPSVYDFIALEYLDFASGNRHISPVAPSDIDWIDESYFAPGQVKRNSDAEPLYQLAFDIFEMVAARYQGAGHTRSQLHWDMNKIEFYYKISNDEEARRAAWLTLSEFYKSQDDHLIPFITYLRETAGRESRDNASQLSFPIAVPGGDKKLHNKTDIFLYAQSIAKKYPGSELSARAIDLMAVLNAKMISINVPEVVLPQQPTPMLLSYRNISSVRIDIHRMDYMAFMRHTDNKTTIDPGAGTLVKSSAYDLEQDDDMEEHSVEVPLHALDQGFYVIKLYYKSSGGQYMESESYTSFQVSGIAFIEESDIVNHDKSLIFLDRHSGKALTPVSIEVYEVSYKTKNGTSYYQFEESNIIRPSGHQVSYKDLVKTKRKGAGNRRLIVIKKGNDRLYHDAYFYFNPGSPVAEADRKQKKDLLYIDRGVYRPGQKLYFKLISYQNEPGKKNKYAALAGSDVTVYLYDANYSKIDSMTLKTNQWGSAAGEFLIPDGLLNGHFTLRTSNDGVTNFRVEEYKRPTYVIEFDKQEASYKLGETIGVKGKAEAYAGYGIAHAKVDYTIQRQVYYPYLWRCYWMPVRPSHVLLAKGSVSTNENGEFEIPLALIPDNKISKDTEPVFTYHINVTVTDITGEVKIQNHVISAGYHSEFVKINVNDVVEDHTDSLTVGVYNINDIVLDRAVTVRVYKLAAGGVKRKRMWDMPDKHLFSREEFEEIFPHDEYLNESSLFDREKKELIFEQKNIPSGDGRWDMADLPLNVNGYYIVEAEMVSGNGQAVMEKQVFHVYKKSNTSGSEKPILITDSGQKGYQPGEQLNIGLVTPGEGRFLIGALASHAGEKKFMDQSAISHTVAEEDRGGIALNVMYVHNNRFYNEHRFYSVPFSNKELKLKWHAHQDKVVPGQKETWSFEVLGDDPQNIEMLSVLYDASLDEIYENSFTQQQSVYTSFYSRRYYQQVLFGHSSYRYHLPSDITDDETFVRTYPELGRPYLIMGPGGRTWLTRGGRMRSALAPASPSEERAYAASVADETGSLAEVTQEMKASSNLLSAGDAQAYPEEKSDITVRKNLNETAYFFPLLRDEKGLFKLNFEFPESNTKWKMMTLAHTPDMKFGQIQGAVQSQKEIMIQPNVPRFVRQGDRLQLSSKVVNMSDKPQKVTAFIEILDPFTETMIHSGWLTSERSLSLDIQASSSSAAHWDIRVPAEYNGLLGIRYYADAAGMQDAVEYILPVMPDKELITEAYPVYVNGNGEAKVTINTDSETLQPRKLVVEYSASPMWYVIQSMPSLFTIESRSADGTAQQLLMTSLALKIASENPDIISKIKRTAEGSVPGSASVQSRLDQNEDLKKTLLQETPWVLESASMAEQIAGLVETFDTSGLKIRQQKLHRELFRMQNADGGWPWFEKMNSDEYVTTSILRTLLKIQEWNISRIDAAPYQSAVEKAIGFLDGRFDAAFDKYWKNKETTPAISHSFVNYMLVRLELKNVMPLAAKQENNFDRYFKHIHHDIFSQHHYQKAQLAIIAHHLKDTASGRKLIESIRQSAVVNEEMGMYWPAATAGYYWYNNNYEAHNWVIKAFRLYDVDEENMGQLKKWILKQKQTRHWGNTRNTVYALDALVLSDQKWVNADPALSIAYNSQPVDLEDEPSYQDWKYIRKVIDSAEYIPHKKVVDFTVRQSEKDMPSWGAVYWQYEETFENVRSNPNTPFKIVKKYFTSDKSSSREKWVEVKEGTVLEVGDVVKIQLLLQIDRDIEYVHLKDYRPSAFEPAKQSSGYTYGMGMGYYMNVGDASVDFFIDRVNKGFYTLEYEVKVESRGAYQSGISEVQSYYAPEFRNVYPSRIIRID